jgi:hypothetical protein
MLVRSWSVARQGDLRKDGPMSEEPVRLRPIEEADLDFLRRFDTDPSCGCKKVGRRL